MAAIATVTTIATKTVVILEVAAQVEFAQLPAGLCTESRNSTAAVHAHGARRARTDAAVRCRVESTNDLRPGDAAQCERRQAQGGGAHDVVEILPWSDDINVQGPGP